MSLKKILIMEEVNRTRFERSKCHGCIRFSLLSGYFDTHTHTHYNIVCSFNWVHFHHIDEIILNLTFVVKLNAANVSEWMSWMIWVNECECVLKMEYLCETLHKIVTIHSKHWIIFHNNATRCEQSVCTMSDTHIHTIYLILAWIRGYSYTHCRILSE